MFSAIGQYLFWREITQKLIEERFDPERTILTLKFVEKQAKKASNNIAKIYEYLVECGEATNRKYRLI